LRNTLKGLWTFLASIQFAIALLIILILVSLLGMLIPQSLHPHQYLEALGPFRSTAVLTLGLDHVFSAIWFYALLGALSVNVMACSGFRAYGNIRQLGRARFLHSPADIDKMELHQTLNAATQADSAMRIIQGYLRRRFFTCATRPEPSGFQIAAKSGLVKEIGSLVFHLSLVVLIAGGVVGKLRGYSVIKHFHAGDTAPVPERTFQIRCDWFRIERNKETITDYKTKLTILDSIGGVKAVKVIEVNSPLRYQGIRMYQSSYGYAGDRFEACSLRVKGPSLPPDGCTVVALFNATVVLPGTDIGLRITRFIPDFMIDMETRQAATRSPNPNNPAVKILLLLGRDTLMNSWAFAKFPHFHGAVGPYQVSFLGYTPSLYTGIQIVENPGAGLIWFGLVAMTLAIFALLYGRTKSLWIYVQQATPTTIALFVGGTSIRPAEGYGEEFRTTCKTIGRLLTSEDNR